MSSVIAGLKNGKGSDLGGVVFVPVTAAMGDFHAGYKELTASMSKGVSWNGFTCPSGQKCCVSNCPDPRVDH